MIDKDKPVAVVSGGTTGIGLECVKRLILSGWNVAYFGQASERVEASKQSLDAIVAEHDARVLAGVVDLRDVPSVDAFFHLAQQELGPVRGLVCNAGYSPKGPDGRVPLADVELEEWQDVLAVNQTGAMICCQHALKSMTNVGHGRIVLIGSLAGRTVPKIAGASYAASKSAIVGLARSIVSEYSMYGITANTVCPGRILTEMTGDTSQPENLEALDRIPIGRLGKTSDIARLVEFLMRANSDFINGAIIDVNGGEFVPP
ncbi:MAG: SDR family oxidoreductase [Alphaproteobacteria bacterium]